MSSPTTHRLSKFTESMEDLMPKERRVDSFDIQNDDQSPRVLRKRHLSNKELEALMPMGHVATLDLPNNKAPRTQQRRNLSCRIRRGWTNVKAKAKDSIREGGASFSKVFDDDPISVDLSCACAACVQARYLAVALSRMYDGIRELCRRREVASPSQRGFEKTGGRKVQVHRVGSAHGDVWW